jgi:hypothetical protein
MTDHRDKASLTFDGLVDAVLLSVAEGESGLWQVEYEINSLVGVVGRAHHRAAAMGLLALFYRQGWIELLRSPDGGRKLVPIRDDEDALALILDPKWYDPDSLGDEVIFYIATEEGFNKGMLTKPLG